MPEFGASRVSAGGDAAARNMTVADSRARATSVNNPELGLPAGIMDLRVGPTACYPPVAGSRNGPTDAGSDHQYNATVSPERPIPVIPTPAIVGQRQDTGRTSAWSRAEEVQQGEPPQRITNLFAASMHLQAGPLQAAAQQTSQGVMNQGSHTLILAPPVWSNATRGTRSVSLGAHPKTGVQDTARIPGVYVPSAVV